VTGFDIFHSRLIVSGYLETLTPLRIGAGKSTSAVGADQPVVKDIFDRPIIPGSSLKGALRSHMESLLRSLYPALACDFINTPCLTEKAAQTLDDATVIGETCLCCRLFGSNNVAAKLALRDLEVDADTWGGQYLLLNTLTLKFTLEPNGPILIKSGKEDGANPTLPNMNFVRATHPKSGASTIYLPGASLKGVIRSHAERIIRTLLGEQGCCDPLNKQSACGDKSEFKQRGDDALPSHKVYRTICPACQMFGHTVMASRFLIPDAYPTNAIDVLPIRQMVAIDRRSGGSVNTFTMEVCTEGQFEGRIIVRNFERWQVGLLALVLRDLREGRLSIGFGKSRGLGQVKLTFSELALSYTGLPTDEPAESYVYGVGEILSTSTNAARKGMIADYGFSVVDPPPTSAELVPASVERDWLRTEVILDQDETIFAALWNQVGSWAQYVEARQGAVQ